MIAETKPVKIRTFGWEDKVRNDVDEEIAFESMRGLIKRQLESYQSMVSDFQLLEELEPQAFQDDFLSYTVFGGFKFASAQMDYWEEFWRKHFALQVERELYELEEFDTITAKQALTSVLKTIKGE